MYLNNWLIPLFILIIIPVSFHKLADENARLQAELSTLTKQLHLNQFKEDLNTCACAYQELTKLYAICDSQLDPSIKYQGQEFHQDLNAIITSHIDCSSVTIYK